MGLTSDTTQRVKTAFLSYSQGQPVVSEAMIDQLICGAIPGLSWEQLQEKKRKTKPTGTGYDRSAFFSLVNSDPAYVAFICQHFPPAPPEAKAVPIDGLEVKVAKGF